MYIVINTGEKCRQGEAYCAPKRITRSSMPTVVHETHSLARQEAIRLSKQNPDIIFAVFEATTLVRTPMADTVEHQFRPSMPTPRYMGGF